MNLMDWAPAALLLTVVTYSAFLYVIHHGTAALSSHRQDKTVLYSRTSRFYVAITRRPASTIAFYLGMYELPLCVFIVTGVAISPEALILITEYSWFFSILALGGLVTAASMPKVLSETGTEHDEAT